MNTQMVMAIAALAATAPQEIPYWFEPIDAEALAGPELLPVERFEQNYQMPVGVDRTEAHEWLLKLWAYYREGCQHYPAIPVKLKGLGIAYEEAREAHYKGRELKLSLVEYGRAIAWRLRWAKDMLQHGEEIGAFDEDG